MKDDLKQYITNALYYAYSFNAPTKVVPEFDKWVEEQIEGIDEYFKSETLNTGKDRTNKH